MNIGCFIDENKEIKKKIRWIDLSNEILKINWVNKYMIICGLRDWKILGRKYIYNKIDMCGSVVL